MRFTTSTERWDRRLAESTSTSLCRERRTHERRTGFTERTPSASRVPVNAAGSEWHDLPPRYPPLPRPPPRRDLRASGLRRYVVGWMGVRDRGCGVVGVDTYLGDAA